MFDPRLTFRCYGLTFTIHLRGLAVLGVTTGGALHQLGNQTNLQRSPAAWAFALSSVCVLFLFALVSHEIVRQRQWG
ncbi:MAG: hypothetical protein C4346_17880, partial [Chloroflexota bacterium]